jgi:hypothetical protein
MKYSSLLSDAVVHLLQSTSESLHGKEELTLKKDTRRCANEASARTFGCTYVK